MLLCSVDFEAKYKKIKIIYFIPFVISNRILNFTVCLI
jgi:hypothetical protein